MKRFASALFALLLSVGAFAQSAMTEELAAKCAEGALRKYGRYAKEGVERLSPSQLREIADNAVLYQNEDGGWPKNIDMMSTAVPADVVASLPAHRRRSTIDNNSVYPEIELLATVYALTGETKYRDAALRGVEFILATQYPDGGWRGWDADAITFNDGVIAGVLHTWLNIIKKKPQFAWVDKELRNRVRASFDEGIRCVLACQYVQNGVKTAWAQQYDHHTLQPVKARAYEFPGIASAESAGVVSLLMRISEPAPEIVEAVKCAVAWFERSKICGIRLETVPVPEEEREEPGVKKTRIIVEDPDARPLWARYYELETNRPFFSDRRGIVLYDYMEVSQERRGGYGWYGSWPQGVLDKYPAWLERIGEKPVCGDCCE
ncbi:MAG: pectate lyase [Alistipes sp.]|nr:pectate lyase [Alistipes sp.]